MLLAHRPCCFHDKDSSASQKTGKNLVLTPFWLSASRIPSCHTSSQANTSTKLKTSTLNINQHFPDGTIRSIRPWNFPARHTIFGRWTGIPPLMPRPATYIVSNAAKRVGQSGLCSSGFCWFCGFDRRRVVEPLLLIPRKLPINNPCSYERRPRALTIRTSSRKMVSTS